MPTLAIDAALLPEELNWQLFDELAKFEPFGQGNQAPVFLMKDLTVLSVRLVGNGDKHLKLEVRGAKQPAIFKAIGFGLGKNGGAELKSGDQVDLVFEVQADEWQGQRDLGLRIIDFKKV